MSPIIINLNNAKYRKKMVAFDYDWTLVNPKEGNTFPKDINDWTWYSSIVPNFMKQQFKKDCMIVIFTNQSKDWKVDQIQTVLETLEIPLFIVIARSKKDYKPNISLFNYFIDDNSIDLKESYYVGDALGRRADFSDSDKLFAENIGIQYYSPEEMFLINYEKKIDITLDDKPEILIMVGYPGSGKSTIAKHISKEKEYIHIKGDDYKSDVKKMIKASITHLEEGKQSVIYDATNSSKKRRKLFIDLGIKYSYSVKCIHVDTPLALCIKRNKLRDIQVPSIAFAVYNKHYEQPFETGDMSLLTICF
tara:strand:+ start:1347 stop:2264 length:918 start_codon:yes stop_codon:yes gene_type:complete